MAPKQTYRRYLMPKDDDDLFVLLGLIALGILGLALFSKSKEKKTSSPTMIMCPFCTSTFYSKYSMSGSVPIICPNCYRQVNP